MLSGVRLGVGGFGSLNLTIQLLLEAVPASGQYSDLQRRFGAREDG
jgi:hypothetical protein